MVVNGNLYSPLQEARACAWVIDTPDSNEWAEGGGAITGLPSDQNRYRSNLGGQLGITSFVVSVNFSTGNYVLKTVCDDLSALNRVGIKHKYIRCSSKHFHMLSIISKLLEKSKYFLSKNTYCLITMNLVYLLLFWINLAAG